MSAAVDRAALIEAAAEAACARVMPRECAVWPEHVARAERSLDAVLPLIAAAIEAQLWREIDDWSGVSDEAWNNAVGTFAHRVRSLGGPS